MALDQEARGICAGRLLTFCQKRNSELLNVVRCAAIRNIISVPLGGLDLTLEIRKAFWEPRPLDGSLDTPLDRQRDSAGHAGALT